ncbi:SEFIR domain-containing protein [Paenibacillus sp. FSL E2-0178]|uniref:SEFIR domain-containing protein n=1 Tax=Paenibacillus sp. FSL E2-0178 TaxID=2921361 RepID=UPI0031588484
MATVQNSQPPKVFISYSWTTPEHEAWVYELAQRLMVSDGVDVKLDKWDLKEGNDKFAFMERMVTSTEIDKVLIICDKGYQEKANENKGGVGTEKLLITPEVFESVEQTKFLPIVAERDETGKEYLPNFIKSRIYIDLSQEEKFEQNYEQLIRSIYNAPLYKKPSLGTRPTFLDEEETNTYRTTNIIRQLNNAIDSNPRRVKGLLRNFSDAYIDELDQLRLSYEDFKDNIQDEVIVEKINESLPLRDNFINIVKIISDNESFDVEWFVDIFERLQPFTFFNGTGTFYEIQFDQYNFLIHELFIYTVAILLKNDDFDSLSYILNTQYYVQTRNHDEKEINYLRFRHYPASLEQRNTRLELRKVSLHALLYIERLNEKVISKSEFTESDLFLHYYSSVLFKDLYYSWFPVTYIYREREGYSLKFFVKLKSKRRAEKVAPLFNKTTVEELRTLLNSYEEKGRYGYSESFSSVPRLQSIIKPDEIAINP